MIKYSAANNGFYPSEIHGSNIPDDAIEITAEEYAALMAAQTAGKRIEADANGAPVAVDPPAPTSEQIIAALSAQIQKRLDDFAATRKYDNVISLAKYSSLTDEEIASLPANDQAAATRYRVECRHLLVKVAQTWAVSERILGDVLSSARPVPSSIADFEAELPVLAWPV